MNGRTPAALSVLTCMVTLVPNLGTAHAATLTGRPAMSAGTANDPIEFVQQTGAQKRLRTLLGPIHYRFFQKDFRAVSTLQLDRNVAVVSGCRPHDCASFGSLVIYDRQHDALKVWLTTDGKTKTFQEFGWRANGMLNSDTRIAVSNLN